jgi:hypothetical protein
MKFYFDMRDGNGVCRDDDGEELSSVAIARDVALKTVWEAIKDVREAAHKGALNLRCVTARGPSSRFWRPHRWCSNRPRS